MYDPTHVLERQTFNSHDPESIQEFTETRAKTLKLQSGEVNSKVNGSNTLCIQYLDNLAAERSGSVLFVNVMKDCVLDEAFGPMLESKNCLAVA